MYETSSKNNFTIFGKHKIQNEEHIFLFTNLSKTGQADL